MVGYAEDYRDARVAELADAQDLGSCGETRGGSTPLSRTLLRPSGYGERATLCVAALIFGVAVWRVFAIFKTSETEVYTVPLVRA